MMTLTIEVCCAILITFHSLIDYGGDTVSIKPDHLRTHVIEPTLSLLGAFDERMNTPASVELLMGTAAQESDLGYYLVQTKGPALGIYQIEPATHDSIWKYYINRKGKEKLREIIYGICGCTEQPDRYALITNLAYATAVARLKYWPIAAAIPEDMWGQAEYWDKWFNANPLIGTTLEYVESYKQFVVK